MWRSKKFIIIAVLAAVVLAGTIGGVALAQTSDNNTSKAQTKINALLDKVAEIYQKNTGTAIDSAELQKAFTEAGKALQSQALDNYLQKLVTDGKITQEQADQYKNWLNSKPDVPLPFGKNNGGGMMPFGGMHRGFGGPGGGLRGWGAPNASDNVTD